MKSDQCNLGVKIYGVEVQVLKVTDKNNKVSMMTIKIITIIITIFKYLDRKSKFCLRGNTK